jgi:hypothetical protein
MQYQNIFWLNQHLKGIFLKHKQMEFIFKKIDDLRRSRNLPKMKFYAQIGMSERGYNTAKAHASLKLQTLAKVAAVLEVPINYFFEDKTPEDLKKPAETGGTVNTTINASEHTPEWGLQSKLMECIDKLEALYERLLHSEAERMQLRQELQQYREKAPNPIQH